MTKTTKNCSLSKVKYMLFGDWRNGSVVRALVGTAHHEQTHIQAKHSYTEN